MALWGIDLGGTKIEGVIIQSRDNPEVIVRERIDTQASEGYKHILARIQQLIEILQDKSGLTPEKIGIGTPGTLDPKTGTLKNSNTVCLNDKPFKNNLSELLQVPVAIANDANCFALAETVMGSVKDHCPNAEVTFGVIMGTGVGGGVVVNGRVLNGLHGIGGEWGHNFLDESGGPCYCGRAGCVETILSGTALERYHEAKTGTFKKLKSIYMDHLAGNDPEATDTINRLITYFGKAMAVIINILDPDAIVLGGGVGNIELLYTEGVIEVKKYVFNKELKTAFLKPKLGDSAGVFGAAFLD